MAAAAVHVSAARNALYKASQEVGNNKTKRALLQTAFTELGSSISTATAPLTAGQKVVARAAQTQVQYAMDQQDNTQNGSIGLALNEKRGAEYLHVNEALAKTATILTTA